jgi:hypothetical protein
VVAMLLVDFQTKGCDMTVTASDWQTSQTNTTCLGRADKFACGVGAGWDSLAGLPIGGF